MLKSLHRVDRKGSLQFKPSLLCLQDAFPPELIGACAYIACFAFPFKWDVALIVLALMGFLASVRTFRDSTFNRSSFVFLVFIFLAATLLSMFFSEDLKLSMRLSASLLPGTLLFLLVSHFRSTQHTRLLYFTFSVVGLGFASSLLFIAIKNIQLGPFDWIAALGSPILVVKNDVTFLAVIAPFSFALFYLKPRSVVGILAGLSLILTICLISIFQSLIAILTMYVSLISVVAFLWPRFILACGLLILCVLFIIYGLPDFPHFGQYSKVWDPRIAFSLVALLMFFDAPLLGHGPHTFGLFYTSYLPELNAITWLPFNPSAAHWIDPRPIPWAHNLYLEILAEQGIIGFVSLMLLLTWAMLTAWKSKSSKDNEMRILVFGAISALTGFLVAAMFELSFQRQWVVIILFVIIGIICNVSSFQTEKQKEV